MIDLKIVIALLCFVVCGYLTKYLEPKKETIEQRATVVELRADTAMNKANELKEQTDSILNAIDYKTLK